MYKRFDIFSTKVELTNAVIKNLKNVPHYIVDKLHTWINRVEERRIEEIRSIPGFNDEPLKGKRK